MHTHETLGSHAASVHTQFTRRLSVPAPLSLDQMYGF